MVGPVALVAALQVEAEEIANSLSRSATNAPGIPIWEGELDGRRVVLAVGGVGKVAAAMTAQFLCDSFTPRCLLSFGLAGALKASTPAGQVIVVTGAVQHDFDARPLARERGEIPGLELTTFAADKDLVQRLLEAAGDGAPGGIALTGDQIIASQEQRDRLLAQFPDASCLDMETAALAQVATQNSVPWAGLRVTSDSADESFDLDQVIGFGVSTAGSLFERIMRDVVKQL